MPRADFYAAVFAIALFLFGSVGVLWMVQP